MQLHLVYNRVRVSKSQRHIPTQKYPEYPPPGGGGRAHVVSFIVVRKPATKEAFVHVSVEERVKTLSN